MGLYDSPTDQIVPARSVWYVRTGLGRALDLVLRHVQDLEALIAESDSERHGSAIASLEGFASYQRQWLMEALDSFRFLPDDLKPHHENVKMVENYFEKRKEQGKGY